MALLQWCSCYVLYFGSAISWQVFKFLVSIWYWIVVRVPANLGVDFRGPADHYPTPHQ